ncbi:MAG: hypothetical protein FWD40_00930 [Treponema sp.]|nr:hypothetical protein [Treponema sp.]
MGNIISQIFGIIKRIVLIAIVITVPMLILRCAASELHEAIVNTAISALDSTTLYTRSKDAYLNSIITGQRDIKLYTITRDTPYYSSILNKEKLEDAEPLGILSRGAVVELRNVIRRGEHVWIPVFFYVGEKPQHAFALFPREWEQNVSEFDREARIQAIQKEYEAVMKKEFQLMTVAPADEKEYKEKYNDYFKVRGMSGENYFYAPRTDRALTDRVYSYYLNPNNMNMVILQTDKEWVRPALVIKNEEDE